MGKTIQIDEFKKQVRFFFECKECGATDFVEAESLENALSFECDSCGEYHLIREGI